jgi:hypothetical protein
MNTRLFLTIAATSCCLLLTFCGQKQGEVVSDFSVVDGSENNPKHDQAVYAPDWFASPPADLHGAGTSFRFNELSKQEVFDLAFKRAVSDLNANILSFIRFEEFYVNDKRYVDAEVGIDFDFNTQNVVKIDSALIDGIAYMLVAPEELKVNSAQTDLTEEPRFNFGLNKTLENTSKIIGYGEYKQRYTFEVNRNWTLSKHRSFFSIAEFKNTRIRAMVEDYSLTETMRKSGELSGQQSGDTDRYVHKASLVAFRYPKVVRRWKEGDYFFTVVEMNEYDITISEENL